MAHGFSIINPYSQAEIGGFEFAEASAIEGALQQLSQKGRAWQKKATSGERAEILRALAALTQANVEALAALVTAESGKTITDARLEITRAAATLTCAAEEARRLEGVTLDSDAYGGRRHKTGVVTHRPIGTVLAITPFNFPINIAAHKIGPAFAAGNTIFFKPHPQNYLSSERWIELCRRAGIPEAVLVMCMVDLPALGALIEDPRIDCINFTGGNVAADAIAARSGYKKLLMELGGNDPLIVLPDGDLEAAAGAAIQQRFHTAGQRCTAAKRLFVHAACYEAFLAILLEKTRALVVGDPADDATVVGPLIHARAADEVMSVIQEALEAGATLRAGGTREGNVIAPTVLTEVPKDARLVREETFGPVIPVQSFTELDEVIDAVNSAAHGLQAGVFTHDLRVVHALFDALEVGTLAVNEGPGFRAEHFPFGGVKASGIGREGVAYAMREMSVLKTLVF